MERPAQEYGLCGPCAERQGYASGEFLLVKDANCFICGGLMARTARVGKAVARLIRRYEFRTFAVGVSLPEGVQDREDEFRAARKLKGKETVKTQAARFIAEEASGRLGKRVDRNAPDVMVVADLGAGTATASSRPLFWYARYSKPPGISQKRELCRECGGRGCKKCGMTGFERGPSVEAELRRKLAAASGSDRMKFTWIGSEDRDSRVYPPGRPFVVELKNPVRRRVPRKFAARSKGGTITVTRGRALPSKPLGLPSFRFRTEIRATAGRRLGTEELMEVRRRFRGTHVRFERPHERPAEKTVYRAAARMTGRTLVVDAVLDGGLPVKRFASGELVYPSLSEVLKTEVRCRTFDIREVKETGEFEFAKVTWI